MINVLLLLGVILTLSLQNITKRISSDRAKGSGAFFFAAISSLFALIVFLFNSIGEGLDFQLALLPYSIGFAVTYSMAVIFLFLAIREGSLALTSLIVSYSLIIPTIAGLILYKESADLMLWIGLGLLMLSLLFINMGKKSEEHIKITPKWLLFVSLAFLGNGGCSTFANLQQRSFEGQFKNEFMIIALLIVVAITLIAALISDRKGIPAQIKSGGLWSAIGGLSNGITNLFVLILSNAMPASLMFPMISAGGTLCMVAVSVFFYKEKLTLQQFIAVILGLGAIVFLNL